MAGRGAGGSIWITARSLSGAGAIQANGGTGNPSSSCDYTGRCAYRYSGAGGRIALSYETTTFSGAVEAVGGPNYPAWRIGAPAGGPGTVAREDRRGGVRQRGVDNGGRPGQQAVLTDPVPTVWEFEQVELIQGGHLELLDPDGSIILTPDNMAGDGSAQLHFHGALAFDLPELRPFGFYGHPGSSLQLPSGLTLRGVALSNYGRISGLERLTLRRGRLANYGEISALASLRLRAEGAAGS